MRTFLATSFGLAVALNVQALPLQYVPVDLGAIPSGFVVYAGKGPNINFAAQVAGATGLADVRAAIYDSQAQSLTVIPGVEGFRSVAQGINEHGEVAGIRFPDPFDYRGFVYDGVQVKDIATLGGNTEPLAISSTGYVTGDSYVNGKPHAFLWDGTQMVDIDASPGSLSIGRAVSANGYVAGLADFGGPHAFFWNGNVMQMLTDATSSGEAVNSAGQVAGYFYRGLSSNSHAFLWDEGVLTDLGTLGGTFSNAQAINERGWVAGYSTTAQGNEDGFVYRDGEMIALPNPFSDNAYNSSSAWNINDAGQVMGLAVDDAGYDHVIRWDVASIPEPGTLALLAAALGGIGLARPRKLC